MRRTHTHPCRHCQKPVSCPGEWEPNSDGFPEVICSDYHLPNGMVVSVRCEDCEKLHGSVAR